MVFVFDWDFTSILFTDKCVIIKKHRAIELSLTVWAETGDFRDTHTGMSSNGTMDHPQLPFPAASRNRTRDRKGKYLHYYNRFFYLFYIIYWTTKRTLAKAELLIINESDIFLPLSVGLSARVFNQLLKQKQQHYCFQYLAPFYF